MLANSSMLVSLHEFLRSYHGVTLSKWVFQLQVYVVYMGKGLQGDSSDRQHGTRRLHYQMLAAVHDGTSVRKKIISYPVLICRHHSSFQRSYKLDWLLRLSSQLGEGACITCLHLQQRFPRIRGQTEQRTSHEISR